MPEWARERVKVPTPSMVVDSPRWSCETRAKTLKWLLLCDVRAIPADSTPMLILPVEPKKMGVPSGRKPKGGVDWRGIKVMEYWPSQEMRVPVWNRFQGQA